MSLRQSTPGEGGRSRRVHFAYVTTKHGQTWHAWMAGPPQWFQCHTKGRTKPCLDAITGAQLVCPLCASTAPTEEIGYVPLYREVDSKPVMVLVHSYTREVVDSLTLHARVSVLRGTDQADGVAVVRALSPTPRFQTTLAEKLRPADLTETLLRVWAIPELMAWYRETHGPSESGVCYTPGQKGAPRITPPADKGGYVPPATDEVMEASIDRIKDRIRAKLGDKPSANGKHG